MTRKLPIIPTILVALAVATMIGLGIWQLERRQQKEALLASYAAAAGKPPIGWPSIPPHARSSRAPRRSFETTARIPPSTSGPWSRISPRRWK